MCGLGQFFHPSLTGVEPWRTAFTVSPDGNKVACKVLPDADRKFLPKFNKWQIAVGNQLGSNFDDVGLPVLLLTRQQ